jgi:hypothetical protein
VKLYQDRVEEQDRRREKKHYVFIYKYKFLKKGLHRERESKIGEMEINFFDIVTNISENKHILKYSMTSKQNAYYLLSMKSGSLNDTHIANQLFWSQYFYLALQTIQQQKKTVHYSQLKEVKQFLEKQAKLFSVKINPVSGNILQIPKCLLTFGQYIKRKVNGNEQLIHHRVLDVVNDSKLINLHSFSIIVYTVCLIYYILWIYHSNFVMHNGNRDFEPNVG